MLSSERLLDASARTFKDLVNETDTKNLRGVRDNLATLQSILEDEYSRPNFALEALRRFISDTEETQGEFEPQTPLMPPVYFLPDKVRKAFC
jgi:hypothetical protein